jgi:hypothetical protein
MQEEDKKEKVKMIAVDDYKLADQAGIYVGWFGIVREATWDEKKGVTSLLIEHKYYDGLTDLHIQVVSINGAGDFTATIPKQANIPPLSLVRVYGKVSKDKDGSASVAAEYVRVWDWGFFTFMDYGKDKTNPKWLKLRKLDGEDAYSSRPDDAFYEKRIGTRKPSSTPNAAGGK